MKRAIDIIGSASGLLLLAPIFLIIAVAIVIDSGRPVFFRQVRIGRGGEPFRILKFRTMNVGAASDGSLTLANDTRVTRVGTFLRHYKLDEIPQLVNVLLGNMSLVGPRPEVQEFMEFYSEEDRRIILSVRPGITDNASIVFSSENSLLTEAMDPRRVYIEDILPRKIALYREYVDTQNILGDLTIIVRTLGVVFFGRSFGR